MAVQTADDSSMIGQRVLSGSSDTVVAVHVTAPDAHTTVFPEQLRSNMFYDDVNLQTHFNDCSRGMLKMEPFHGPTQSKFAIDRGVAEVAINTPVVGKSVAEVQTAVLHMFDQKYGNPDNFDHVFFGLVSAARR